MLYALDTINVDTFKACPRNEDAEINGEEWSGRERPDDPRSRACSPISTALCLPVIFFFYHYFSFLLISHFVAKVQLSAVEKLTVKYKNNNRGNTRSCSATAAIPARGSCGFRAREYEGHEKSRMRIARRLKDYRIYLERAPHTHKRATFVAVLSHPCYIRVRTRGNEASGGRPRDFERRYRLKRAVSREPRLVPRRNV